MLALEGKHCHHREIAGGKHPIQTGFNQRCDYIKDVITSKM
jgi:hypothetical protein